jgi:hypothetical protein
MYVHILCYPTGYLIVTDSVSYIISSFPVMIATVPDKMSVQLHTHTHTHTKEVSK